MENTMLAVTALAVSVVSAIVSFLITLKQKKAEKAYTTLLRREIYQKNSISEKELYKIIKLLERLDSSDENKISKNLELKYKKTLESALYELSLNNKLEAKLVNTGIHQPSENGRIRYSAKLINMALQKQAS